MAKEIIEKILKSELDAEELEKFAYKKVEKILIDAEKLIEKLYKEKIKNAKNKALSEVNTIKQQANLYHKQVIEETNREINDMINYFKKKESEAIDLIVKRVVE
ncbi:MAG: hypothetical protein LBT82_02245 [Oscillospiraceae bacterium]|nr:hypothetical protein [Oscillospiraceae bacterium]